MEYARKRHHVSDLAHRETVFKSKPQEQAVAWAESFERTGERGEKFTLRHLSVDSVAGLREVIGIH